MSISTQNKKYGSDYVVDVLNSIGYKYAPLNPGASFRGLHDSIVNYGKNDNPKLVLCCHEEIAVAIASGYYRASGKPLVVLVHDVEGLLHATKAVYDAFTEREGIVIIGGNGPTDTQKRRPGIDWLHTPLIPGLAVRNYVKWDDQPDGLLSTIESLIRANNIALTDPPGPVYISLDAELQETVVEENVKLPDVEKYPVPTFGEGDIESITAIAKSLCEAESPTFVLERYGRDDQSISELVKLVELTGAAVIDSGQRFNFPSNHPQNLSGLDEEILGKSDVVVTLGVKDLYFALAKEEKGHFSRESKYMTRPECNIVRIDTESITHTSWLSEHGRISPTSKSIVAYEPAAVSRMLKIAMEHVAKNSAIIEERKSRLGRISAKQREKWLETARQQLNQSPITYPALAYAVWEKMRTLDWVIAYPGYARRGINTWLRQIWDISKFFQYPGRGGGTGTGIGRAIGAALANSDKICVDFQPDGDLLYTASSLWTARNLGLPLLIFVLNNQSYFNDEEHQRSVAEQRGRPVENKTIGIRFDRPRVDFSALAKSCGLGSVGHPISEIKELEDAIGMAIDSVHGKKVAVPYLLDVEVQPKS